MRILHALHADNPLPELLLPVLASWSACLPPLLHLILYFLHALIDDEDATTSCPMPTVPSWWIFSEYLLNPNLPATLHSSAWRSPYFVFSGFFCMSFSFPVQLRSSSCRLLNVPMPACSRMSCCLPIPENALPDYPMHVLFGLMNFNVLLPAPLSKSIFLHLRIFFVSVPILNKSACPPACLPLQCLWHASWEEVFGSALY
jgi:hypothetical protein